MNKGKQIIRNEKKDTKKKSGQPMDSDKKLKLVIGAGVLAFVLLVAIVCYETFHKDPVLRVGDQNYYVSDMEVLYNVYQEEMNIENMSKVYEQYLGYGKNAYWNANGVKANGKNSAMSAAISNIVLAKEAEKEGMTLTEDEVKEIEEQVDKLLSKMTKSRLSKTGFTKEGLETYLKQAKLAANYSEQLIESYDVTEEDVTVDQAEYDERTVEAVSVLLKEQDASGNSVAVSDEKKAEYKAKMEDYLEQAKSGVELSKLLEEGDKTYSYGELDFIVGKEEVTASVEEAALKLENGQLSDLIETDTAFIFIKMKDSASTNKYDEAVKEAIKTKQDERLAEDVKRLQEEYDVEVLSKGWDKVDLGTVTMKMGEELSELAPDETPAPSTEPTATPEAE